MTVGKGVGAFSAVDYFSNIVRNRGLQRQGERCERSEPQSRPSYVHHLSLGQAEYYRCLDQGCQSHRCGFARQWNMFEHYRLCHRGSSSGRTRPTVHPFADPPQTCIFGEEASKNMMHQSLRAKLARLKQKKENSERTVGSKSMRYPKLWLSM